MKVCKGCGQAKPLDDYYFTGKYPQSRCKPCFSKQSKVNYERNPEYQRMRRRRYLYKYDDEMIDNLLLMQDEGCAICDRIISKATCHVDHNKATGEVRGLLCNKCNPGLGMFNEDIELLLQAARYLGWSDV